MHSEISHFLVHRNSVPTLPYEKRGITSWVECSHHKEVPHKASLQFISKDIPISPQSWMCSRTSLRESVHDAVSKLRNRKKISSMWDEYTYISQSSFTKAFFQLLSEEISFSTIANGEIYSQMSPDSLFYIRDSPIFYEKKSITLWVECTRHKAAPWKSSLQYLSEDISVFTVSLSIPDYPLAD